jgi:hypothetical protein
MRHFFSVLAVFAVASVAAAAPVAVNLNFNMTRYRVDAATNAELFIPSNPFQSDSLALAPGGQLYSADISGNIFNVTVAAIPVGPTLRTAIADLDYANNGLWGFSNTSRELFFFDLGSSAVTYSQVISGTGALTMTGVAYEPSTGDVYLSGYSTLNTDQLFRVPASSSSATFVGAMPNGDAFSYFADIDFDPSGTLYAMSFFHRYFYSVSTSTGATTLLSTGPHRDTTAMALDPVPEPATIGAMALGSVGLLWRRRVRSIA